MLIDVVWDGADDVFVCVTVLLFAGWVTVVVSFTVVVFPGAVIVLVAVVSVLLAGLLVVGSLLCTWLDALDAAC